MNPYCQKIQRQLDEYHDDQLAPFVRRLVEQHLKTCATCKKEYFILQTAVEAIRQKPAEDIPPRVLTKVIRSLTESGRGGKGLPEPLFGNDLSGEVQTP